MGKGRERRLSRSLDVLYDKRYRGVTSAVEVHMACHITCLIEETLSKANAENGTLEYAIGKRVRKPCLKTGYFHATQDCCSYSSFFWNPLGFFSYRSWFDEATLLARLRSRLIAV